MKKIIWEHADIYFSEILGNFNTSEETQGDEFEVHENQEDINFLKELSLPKGYAINTPFGVYDLKDPLTAIKRTELRIGNTNFNISNQVAGIINGIEGVDAFKVISRYSFIIGIGKAFNFTQVRLDIEKALNCVDINAEKIPNNIKLLIKDLGNEQYTIFVFPNGEFICSTIKDVDYHSNVSKMLELKNTIDGILIENK